MNKPKIFILDPYKYNTISLNKKKKPKSIDFKDILGYKVDNDMPMVSKKQRRRGFL